MHQQPGLAPGLSSSSEDRSPATKETRSLTVEEPQITDAESVTTTPEDTGIETETATATPEAAATEVAPVEAAPEVEPAIGETAAAIEAEATPVAADTTEPVADAEPRAGHGG